nr:immunoglobulin light chain junction region [Macaca mulatta]
CKQLLEFPLTF